MLKPCSTTSMTHATKWNKKLETTWKCRMKHGNSKVPPKKKKSQKQQPASCRWLLTKLEIPTNIEAHYGRVPSTKPIAHPGCVQPLPLDVSNGWIPFFLSERTVLFRYWLARSSPHRKSSAPLPVCWGAILVRAPFRSPISAAPSSAWAMIIRWCPESNANRVSSITADVIVFSIPLSNALSIMNVKQIPCCAMRVKKGRATSSATAASVVRKIFLKFCENSPRINTFMWDWLTSAFSTARTAATDLPTPGSANTAEVPTFLSSKMSNSSFSKRVPFVGSSRYCGSNGTMMFFSGRLLWRHRQNQFPHKRQLVSFSACFLTLFCGDITATFWSGKSVASRYLATKLCAGSFPATGTAWHIRIIQSGKTTAPTFCLLCHENDSSTSIATTMCLFGLRTTMAIASLLLSLGDVKLEGFMSMDRSV